MRKQLFLALVALTSMIFLPALVEGQGRGRPSGFNKSLIQTRPQANRSSRPASGPHVRPHNAQRHPYRGFGNTYLHPNWGRQNFGFGLAVPFNYGQFNYGWGAYDYYVPLPGRSFYQSEFYGPLPATAYSSLNEMNAARAQQLLDRQNQVDTLPATPSPGTPVPPGFSIANATATPTDELSKPNQLLAEAAFRNRDYRRAYEQVARAISRDRDNGYLWLFSSQVNLANRQYVDAAQDAGLAMKLVPRKDWFWMIENFREFYRNEDYVTQVKQLSQHIQTNPQDSHAHALRAYHYLGLGYPNEAMKDLKTAQTLAPGDQWTKLLIDYVQPILDQSQKKQTVLEAPKPEVLPAPTQPGDKTEAPKN